MVESVVNQSIVDALFSLMEKKNITEISVSELVEKAGVGRASFYRNFGTKEAVLQTYFRDFFQTISYEGLMGPRDLHAGVVCTYKKVFKERKRFSILQKQQLLSFMDDAIYEKSIREMTIDKRYESVYQASGLAGASAFLIRTWIKHRFQETPEELADAYLAMLTMDLLQK